MDVICCVFIKDVICEASELLKSYTIVFKVHHSTCCKSVLLCVQRTLLHQLYCSSSESSLLIQKLLLENTVNLPLLKKFPLKLSYQLTFLKDIITKVFIFVVSLP